MSGGGDRGTLATDELRGHGDLRRSGVEGVELCVVAVATGVGEIALGLVLVENLLYLGDQLGRLGEVGGVTGVIKDVQDHEVLRGVGPGRVARTSRGDKP